MLLGYENIDEDTVGNHKTCRLGIWIVDQSFKDAASKEIINTLEKPHEELHILAKKTIVSYNSGDLRGAERNLDGLNKCSDEVVALLRKLKNIM